MNELIMSVVTHGTNDSGLICKTATLSYAENYVQVFDDHVFNMPDVYVLNVEEFTWLLPSVRHLTEVVGFGPDYFDCWTNIDIDALFVDTDDVWPTNIVATRFGGSASLMFRSPFDSSPDSVQSVIVDLRELKSLKSG